METKNMTNAQLAQAIRDNFKFRSAAQSPRTRDDLAVELEALVAQNALQIIASLLSPANPEDSERVDFICSRYGFTREAIDAMKVNPSLVPEPHTMLARYHLLRRLHRDEILDLVDSATSEADFDRRVDEKIVAFEQTNVPRSPANPQPAEAPSNAGARP